MRLEPVGWEAANITQANLAATTLNAQGVKRKGDKRPFGVADMLIELKAAQEDVVLTDEQAFDVLRAMKSN